LRCRLWSVAGGHAGVGSLGQPGRAKSFGRSGATTAGATAGDPAANDPATAVRPLDEVLAELDGLVRLGAVKAEIGCLDDVLAADAERRCHWLLAPGFINGVAPV
jgi:hypothetical protein